MANKTDQERGLYGKFKVERISDPTGKHKDCEYFVLDLNHDRHATAALTAYAQSCAKEYPQLAIDLRAKVAAMPRPTKPIVTGNFEPLKERNAVIEHASLTRSEHGILTANLRLDYGGTSQAFGGYGLYYPKSFDHHQLLSTAGHFVYRVLEIAGVEEWSQLQGRTIRARQRHTGVDAIGHIVKNDWFTPSEDFA